jgi:ABC-type nitrate/sulfonate/bicarbonate transport system substrate-binding protein
MDTHVRATFSGKTRLLAATAFAALLALGYLGLRERSGTPAEDVERLSIAVPAFPHSSLIYIAAAQGYFAGEGLEVTILPAVHGKAAVELVSQGKADLGAASEVVFVLAALKGQSLGVVAGISSSSSDLAVVARRDRGIGAPRDIAGKRVGVTLGTAGEFFLWAFLIRHKLAPGSITLVDLPPGRIAPELAAGAVDAIVTWQPNVLDAQAALGANAMSFFEPLAYTETFNLIGRGDFIASHRGALERLLRALLKAEQFGQATPEDALRLVDERLKVGADALRASWKAFDFAVALRQSQINTMEEAARWAIESGYSDRKAVPNFLPDLRLDALQAVRPERVTVMR